MIAAMSNDNVLREQVDYYRARAGEYDEWWFRHGRYDRGADFNAQWHVETAAVDAAVAAWLAREKPGRVLELACGTGLFTRHLAPHVAHVTAIDASSEVIAINRRRVDAGNVSYVQADLFQWQTAERYDAVFFSFWLSHVPAERFGGLLDDDQAAALAPGGTAFVIDSAFDRTSTAKDHVLPARETGIVTRKLNDGRAFHIVKLFYEPKGLAARLDHLGWSSNLTQTTNAISSTERYGSQKLRPVASRRDSPRAVCIDGATQDTGRHRVHGSERRKS